MKVRNGFVSNSSSASFIISKNILNKIQIKELLEYNNSKDNYDNWQIYEDQYYIRGDTIMDNSSISDLFTKLLIDHKQIGWFE